MRDAGTLSRNAWRVAGGLAIRPEGVYLDATPVWAAIRGAIAERLTTGLVIANDRDCISDRDCAGEHSGGGGQDLVSSRSVFDAGRSGGDGRAGASGRVAGRPRSQPVSVNVARTWIFIYDRRPAGYAHGSDARRSRRKSWSTGVPKRRLPTGSTSTAKKGGRGR